MRALCSVVLLISGSYGVAAARGILQGQCHVAVDTTALCTDIGNYENCGWCFKWDFQHPEGFACTCNSDHPRAEEFGGCYPTACQNGWECDQPEQWKVDEDELERACDAMPVTICELTPNNTVCCGVRGEQQQYDNDCWAAQGLGIDLLTPGALRAERRAAVLRVARSAHTDELSGLCLCTRELDPQCCLFATFDNPCQAKCEYGEDGFEAVCQAGPCPDCGCEEEDVQPVCCDGGEFPNLCTAECYLGEANATEVCVPGQCEPELEPGCACTLDFQLVCCNGQEFPNQCGAACELGEETAQQICTDGPCSVEELFPGQRPIDFNPVCCTSKMQPNSTETEEQQLTSEPITEFRNLCAAFKAGMEIRLCQPGSCKEVDSRPGNCQLGQALCSMDHCAFVRCPDVMPICIQNDCLEYKIFGRVEVASCEATCVTAEDLAADEECGGSFTLCLTLAEREEECTALNCAPGTSCTINPCAAPISDQAGNMVDPCGVYCKPNDS